MTGGRRARAPHRRDGPGRSVRSIRSTGSISQLATGGRFPGITEVVVVGHSGGGQFAHRYAAQTMVATRLAAAGIRIRFVVANPSSYLYLDGSRFQSSSKTFASLTSAQRSTCRRFDTYKYGLTELGGYGSLAGVTRIRTQYLARHVVYLLGTKDTSTDSTMDTSCPATWQGPDRYTRGNRYVAYLRARFGSAATKTHTTVAVSGVGHDAKAMYLSASGRRALFDTP